MYFGQLSSVRREMEIIDAARKRQRGRGRNTCSRFRTILTVCTASAHDFTFPSFRGATPPPRSNDSTFRVYARSRTRACAHSSATHQTFTRFLQQLCKDFLSPSRPRRPPLPPWAGTATAKDGPVYRSYRIKIA